MVNGIVESIEAPFFEDLASLKKWVRSHSAKYSSVNIHRTIINQAGTAAAVEIGQLQGETIAQIAKTEHTVLLDGSADNASTLGKIYTLKYKDADGVEHTAIGTGTATLSSVPVAFVPAVTDCYCAISFTASAVDANVNVLAKENAGITFATLSTATVASTEAQLSGVGIINMKQKTDQVGTDGGKDGYLIYFTPWGEKKYGFSTMDAANTTAEEVWYEASSLFVATSVLLKDFYILETLRSELVTADEWLVIAVGGATVYGVIAVGDTTSVLTRYKVPYGRTAWLGKIYWTTTVDTKLVTNLTISYIPAGESIATTIVVSIDNFVNWEPCLELAAETDITFTIKGNLTENLFDIQIVEAIDA